MSWLRLTTTLILFSALFLFTPAIALGKDQWLNLNTKNFNVITNADGEQSLQLVLKLEQFRQALLEAIPNANKDLAPLTIYIFRDDASFTPFKVNNTIAYLKFSDFNNYLVANISINSLPQLKNIYHQYAHYLLQNQHLDLPLWLEEGVAEYYSTFKVEQEHVVLGTALETRLPLLKPDKLLSFQELSTINQDSDYYNEGDRQNIFYAQTWSLIHYLIDREPQYPAPSLTKLLEVAKSNLTIEMLLKEAVNLDIPTVEKEYQHYLMANIFPAKRLATTSALVEKSISAQVLADAVVEYHLGIISIFQPKLEAALQHFQQAIQLDPKFFGGYQGLGLLAEIQQDPATAKEKLKLAIEYNPKNFLNHFAYASVLFSELVATAKLIVKNPARQPILAELLKMAINEYNICITLQPEHYRSYQLLGITYLFTDSQYALARENLTKAYTIAPQDKRSLINLARIQLATRNFKEGQNSIDILSASNLAGEQKSRLAALIKDFQAAQSSTTVANNTTENPGTTLSINDPGLKRPVILTKPRPKYTDLARRNHIEGVLVLSIVLSSKGTVNNIKVSQGLGYGLDETAMEAVAKITFTPGEKDGIPVNVRARVEYTFSLIEHFSLKVDHPMVKVKKGDQVTLLLDIHRSTGFDKEIKVVSSKDSTNIEVDPENLVFTNANKDKVPITVKIKPSITPGTYQVILTGMAENESFPLTVTIVVE